eukprot:Skav211299  [mRNA]  locus=scaffold1052:70762:76259:- [translate_table: standard]
MSSLTSEQEALLWAGLWRLAHDHTTPTTFCVDNNTAKGQAAGELGSQTNPVLFASLRGVFQALGHALDPAFLQFHHVKSHQGDTLNEFADWLAGKERDSSFRCSRQDLNMRLWQPMLPYLWMVLQPQPDLPERTLTGFHIPAPHLPDAQSDPVLPDAGIAEALWNAHFRCASANVNSLYKGGDGHAGKLDYLRAQMHSHELLFLGVQEARSDPTFGQTQGIIRIASGSDKGNFGTELWISTSIPFAHRGRSRGYITLQDCVVVNCSPTHLLVRVHNTFCDLWILVAHGPHSGHHEKVRQDWWDTLRALTDCIPGEAHLLCFLDANARTGAADHQHVFQHDDTVSPSTSMLRDFLQHRALCLPSTGVHHEGDHPTWTSPDGLHQQRIDYVAIPLDLRDHVISSHVLQDFDLGNLHPDHWAVGLHIQWQFQGPSARQKRTQVTFARDKIASSHFEQNLAMPLNNSSWQTSIDQHSDALQHRIVNLLVQHCPPDKKQPKKPYVTDECWQLRAERIRLRKRHLDQPAALQQTQLAAHHQNAIAAIHDATWFRMKGQKDAVLTTVGTRPGDSFADCIFTCVFARVLEVIQRRLHELDLVVRIPKERPGLDEPVPMESDVYLGPVWMDDCCVLMSAPHSEALIGQLGVVTGIVLDSCREFGFTPNVDAGKTEILLAPSGRGTKALRNRFFGPSSSATLPVIGEHGTDSISVSGTYRHLGGLITHDAKCHAEVRRRIGIANQAFNDHRRALYQNRQLSYARRRELFMMIVLSKLCYSMDSWMFSDAKTLQFFKAAVMRLYKRLLRVRPDDHRTEAAILADTHLPSPELLLRRSRLRYLGQLHQAGDVVPWGLLRQDRAWCDLLRQDLAWMYDQLANSSPLLPPQDHWAQWQEILQFSPRYWKRLVNRATEHAVRQQRSLHGVWTFHKQAYDYLQAYDHNVAPLPPAAQINTDSRFGCLTCSRRFKSRAGEGAHMCKTHKQVSPLRHLYDSTTCRACLREYHTLDKLQAHLRYSVTCRELLQGQGFRCLPIPGIGSKHNRELQRAHAGLRPVQQSFGPQPQLAAGRPDDPADEALLDYLLIMLLDKKLEAFNEASLKELFMLHPTSWTTWRTSLISLRGRLTQDDADTLEVRLEDLNAHLDLISSAHQWSFLELPLPVDQDGTQLWDYETAFAETADRDQGLHPPQPRPCCFGRERYVLHAFAGRRRYGDFQYFLDELTRSRDTDGILLQVLSVDVIIDPDKGDLMKQSSQLFWFDAMWRGYIIGFIGGPPCNTWSQVRHQALSDDLPGRGPRPVRAPQAPWGFSSLRLSEIDYVAAGNSLLGFSLISMLIMMIQQGCGLLEHPGDPNPGAATEKVTVWRLPLVATLLRNPSVQLHWLLQGCFGSEAPKPTGAMTVNLEMLPYHLQRWKIATTMPAERTTGRDDEGTFHTAKLKEYAPAMCAALAHSFHQALSAVPVTESHMVPEAFRTFAAQLVSSERGTCIGLDHHGS